jgi:cyclopropane fatty-acyl-phospholipid synthase-like methyltransferase
MIEIAKAEEPEFTDMDTVKKSIVKSLDGLEFGLFPYLSYLLQDLWEFGASPQIIIELLKKNNILTNASKVLDLGCGKGAVLIKLVKEFGCQGYGIDALPEFIEEANKYAQKNKVEQNCIFKIGDIRRAISQLNGYDALVLGSIGPVFGDIRTTLLKVKSCLKEDGYIILDDGYLSNNSPLKSPVYVNETETLKQIESAEMKIIDQIVLSSDFIKKSNKKIYDKIHKRSVEMMNKYPEDQLIFEGYLKSQEEENTLLENHITCVTWLLKKKI